jgi:hypothetical protein
MNKLDRQLDLEREMSGLGHRRYEESVITGRDVPDPRHPGEMRHKDSAREAGEETRTDYGLSLLRHSIDLVGMELYKMICGPKGYGPQLASVHFLRSLLPDPTPCERKDGEKDVSYSARLSTHLAKRTEDEQSAMRVVAFIGLQAVINSLSIQAKVTATEMKIGNGLESELKFRYFKKSNPALFNKVFGDLRRREGNFERRKAIMSHSMRTDSSGKASQWQPLERLLLAKVGHIILDLIVTHTDLARIKVVRKEKSKKQAEGLLIATESTLMLMRERLDKSGIRDPVFLPAVCSPKRWQSPLTGGYYSAFEELAPVRMVKIPSAKPEKVTARLLALHEARATMPLVYRALNAVQATPWKVNKPIL